MAEQKANILITAKDKASGAFKKIGQSVGKIINPIKLATIGVGALTVALGFSVKAAMEQQKVLAQMDAVLKSTSNAVGLTKKEIVDLSDSLSNMSGVGNEVIQQGQNMLLTFTNLRSEAFKKASESLLDMTTALTGGKVTAEALRTQAIQLGKALNDPTKGMTALRRVGVAFTDSQEKQIKALQSSGDIMGAQKIILKELQAEYGGSAKAAGNTFAGQVNKLKSVVGDASEEIGEALLPALSSIVTTITSAIQSGAFQNFIKQIKIAFINIGADIEIATTTIKALIASPFKFETYKVIFDELVNKISQVWDAIKNIARGGMDALRKIRAEEAGQEKTLSERIQDIRQEALNKIKELDKERVSTVIGNNKNIVENNALSQEEIEKRSKETLDKRTADWELYLQKTKASRDISQEEELAGLRRILEDQKIIGEERTALLMDTYRLEEEIRKSKDKKDEDALKLRLDKEKEFHGQLKELAEIAQKDGLKAAGEQLKEMLKAQIDAWVQSQIGEATVKAPLSFGSTLAAIAPIFAAGEAAKAAISAIKFHDGGVVTEANSLPAPTGDPSERVVIAKTGERYLGAPGSGSSGMASGGSGGKLIFPIIMDQKEFGRAIVDTTNLKKAGLL